MQLASDAGATIFPVIPTFYNHPQTTQDMARNFVHRSSLPALVQAKIEGLRWHDLRHTFASRLVTLRVDTETPYRPAAAMSRVAVRVFGLGLLSNKSETRA